MSILCDSVEITASRDRVSLEVDGMDIDDVVNHFGHEDLLEEIGKDKAMEHFGLVEEEQ